MVNKTQAQVVIWISAAAALLAGVWIASPQWLLSATAALRQQQPRCRCFPGDACWPSPAEWASFNETLGGRLIATVPLASPCHDDDFGGVSRYDADRCAAIRARWGQPELHDGTTHSPMTFFFGNASCDPFAPREAPCVLGAYVPYAVNASDASHYRAALAFARQRDVRLVIRNTGHDYNGKSTGAGALALWTHNLKDRVVFDYPPNRVEAEDGAAYPYVGKAMKVGAGVQAGEAQATANALGYVVVEGDCPTVGYAGGYAQGGGTSPLASRFGLAADQVLEWEVVTADGELLTATPSQNSDLYWALSGGGGGTYGVVLSMTVKMHKNMPTAGAILSFDSGDNDAFWYVVKAFLINLPAVLDAGATAYWMVFPGNFRMPQSYFPNGTAEELERLYQPTVEALKRSGIHYEFSTRDYPNYQDAYRFMNPVMPIMDLNFGGRLIPRSLVASESSAEDLTRAIRKLVGKGAALASVSMNTTRPPRSSNSVHPAWRETLFMSIFGSSASWSNMTANINAQKFVTDVLVPIIKEVTPGGGAHLNEADFNEPNWQESFYGVNYPRLLSIKQKYDPEGILWGKTAVGSEGWEVVADGRLCTAGR